MNRQRTVTAICVLALAVLGAWIASHSHWKEITVPMPLQGEAVRNPFYAAQHFAEALGARTQWRRAFGTLPEHDSVILLSSWHWSLIENRRKRLEQWVEAGGRLVVDHSLIGGEYELQQWAGIARALVKPAPQNGEDDTEPEELQQRRDFPAAPDQACAKLTVFGEQPATPATRTRYALCNSDGYSRLTTSKPVAWGLRNSQGMQVVRVNVGRGSVTLINASPFAYRDLFKGDHGLLLVAATQLRAGDVLHFMSEEQRTSLLSLVWKYGGPVVVLALAVMLIMMWRNAVRFGPRIAVPEVARRSLAEQIRGTGQFTLRLGGGQALHVASVRALHEAADRHITRYARLRGEERIAALARFTGFDAGALAEAIHYAGPRRSAELRHALELIESARRKVLAAKKN